MTTVEAPAAEYQRRLAVERRNDVATSRDDERAAWLRLATFGLGILIAVIAWNGRMSWWWLIAPVATFAFLIRWHDAVLLRRDRARKLTDFYERGLARIEDRWGRDEPHAGPSASPGHLYAADLDLFGAGSLFQLLSLARTPSGEHVLARWLSTPAQPPHIAERQDAVRELRTSLDLREHLWSAGSDVATGVHPETLVAWAESKPILPSWLQVVSAVLTAAVVVTAIQAARGAGITPLLTVLAIELAVLYRYLEAIGLVLHRAASWSRDLDVLADVLAHLEDTRFASPLLQRLSADIGTGGVVASRTIRSLHRLSEMHDWQHNVIFAAVATPLLWGVHLALAMERWRRVHGPHVRAWLEAVGEFEALSSMAAYHYEHPDDVFAQIDAEDRPHFVGDGLGHPLLPSTRMIRNDVRLADDQQLLVVSGSNMSGKSTLLRTVGVNAVLAMMGAPVRARSLRLSPLALGATLRIQDSLQEGRSRFFAEIVRLKEIADRSKTPPPMLFLLDELFHGTNSHDRLAGASGVLRALLDRGAIGLITTHDMALAAVADELAPRAINVHFEDQFEGGEMRFDYRMKPGPVTSSNALALMRAVGLDVDGPA